MDGKVERKRVRLMRMLICKLRAVEQLIFLDFVERVGMMAASDLLLDEVCSRNQGRGWLVGGFVAVRCVPKREVGVIF